MADLDRNLQCRLQPGAYLGEISALSFLPLPSHLSSFPLLLAGSGSELLVYDIKTGDLLKSCHVFQGIRVHGILLTSVDSKEEEFLPSSIVDFTIVVFGERKLKVFSLRFDGKASVDMELVGQLPRFDHWILDAIFLKEEQYLAMGLSDNSIALWDMNTSNVLLRVRSPERCLLYSMRIWGDSIKTLRVASGTIHNEITVWRLTLPDLIPSSAYLNCTNQCMSDDNELQFQLQHYVPTHISRLTGHEGSIFRIAWSADGSRMMSVSDDRSARIWKICCSDDACGDLEGRHGCHVLVDLVLFGHNARIWDCYISDSIVITAGEDCTCRVWGMDGKHLATFKEHIGRGIWRCLYDPESSLLVTAGFDSAIKVHLLHLSSLKEIEGHSGMSDELKNPTEIFSVCAPKVPNLIGLMDSKSEYVRCLRFARENILYVATNNGYLYHVQLCHGDAIWTELVQVCKEAPIICIDLISVRSSVGDEDAVAVGDGKGNVTVVKVVVNGDHIPNFAVSCTWSAEKERQLLAIYWCKSLGCSHLFTADPKGVLKLWGIDATFESGGDNTNFNHVSLVATFASTFGARILCINASRKEKILICGDQRGNLTVYSLPEGLIVDNSSKIVEKVPVLCQFKGAHGISSVTSILITTLDLNEVEVLTTGGDGCICYFKYQKNVVTLEFTGMKQVKELSTIQSVYMKSVSEDKFAHGNYAAGFMSADFIIWNLTNEAKAVQIPCGGWRRAHAYYLGDVPECQHCFAYLKDNCIYIHRLWVPMKERQDVPKILHLQYHGRETHSLCFITSGIQSNSTRNCYSWLATGCEDGTVRLTRYTCSDMGRWCESKLLGEHVGGSAVRSLYFVSKIHTITARQPSSSNHALVDRKDDQLLLISVGAKQVLTSWLLQYRSTDIKKLHHNCPNIDSDHISSPISSMSFQWLSTHMPPKFARAHQKLKKKLDTPGKSNSSTLTSSLPLPISDLAEYGIQKPKVDIVDQHDNDWRYLAVTAFLVKHDDGRSTVCFVVVASSDATLMLRALLLPCRRWVDIATFVSQTSPVLALQHLVIPDVDQAKDTRYGNTYIIISGSTDGSITFWDLTETIDGFMQGMLELRLENFIDGQRRPQTGRGSQGGQQRKSLIHQSSPKNGRVSLIRTQANNNSNAQIVEEISVDASSLKEGGFANYQNGSSQRSSDISISEIREIWPLHVLNSFHQSGVNCLHISERKDCLKSESEVSYCILSGGDDQALHYLQFNMTRNLLDTDSSYSQPPDSINHVHDWAHGQESVSIPLKWSNQNLHNRCRIRILHQGRVGSGHSSAVKGIWTDGIWAFSTGLDQRIRCWKIGSCGKLTEQAHLVISVPEPEALDAINCGSGRYQIAVSGRGMQMVEFYASVVED